MKHIPTLVASVILAMPGGVLLAAGQVAQQVNPSELNKDIVQGLLNITGLFLAILLPIAGQQLLSLRNKVNTAQSDVKAAKDKQDKSVSTEEMETVRSDIGLLQETVQSLKDDLRVTTQEKNTAVRERDNYKKDNAVLIEQLADERKITADLSRRCDEQDMKIAELRLEFTTLKGVNELANQISANIEKLMKHSTGEHAKVITDTTPAEKAEDAA